MDKITVLTPISDRDLLKPLVLPDYVKLVVVLDTDGPIPWHYCNTDKMTVITPGKVGLSKALQIGLESCQTHYVARHDADDWSHPERFRIQAEYLDIHPEIVMCATQAIRYFRMTDDTRIGPKLRWLPITQMKYWRNPFIHGSVMFRRFDALVVGGYDPNIRFSQDADLWFRLTRFGRCVILPKILYGVNYHHEQISTKYREEQRDWFRIIQRKYRR